MAYGKLAGSGMGWRAQGCSPYQCPLLCPCSHAGHTLPSPGDAGGQDSSKFAVCHQGEGIVSSLSPQLSPWWHPGAPQSGQCCCALGFILAPYLPHYGLVPGSRRALAPQSQCLPCPPSLPPATMPSFAWLLRVSGGAHTAWVATVAYLLPWA